jgi:2-methylcitrate dehydratase PrpD
MLYQEPEDSLKGKFSAKYNVAAALVDSEIGIETFRDEKIDDPKIQETMDKVRTRVMAKSEEGTTDQSKGLPIRITLKDGRVFDHTTARADILGGQKNPWGFDNIRNKFEVNAGLALSREAVSQAVNTWSDVSQVPDVGGALRQTLVKPESQ